MQFKCSKAGRPGSFILEGPILNLSSGTFAWVARGLNKARGRCITANLSDLSVLASGSPSVRAPVAGMDACEQRLQHGCKTLGLPYATAKELLRFLFVRRCADDGRGALLTPSSKLNTLLRWVLLETHILSQVERLVGAVHYTQGGRPRSEKEKMVTR